VVLEIKGKPLEDTDAKHQAAKRWVAAVNHWGRLVKGIFWCAGKPQRLAEALASLVAARSERIRAVAAALAGAQDQHPEPRAISAGLPV
jgi:hypothetical protein